MVSTGKSRFWLKANQNKGPHPHPHPKSRAGPGLHKGRARHLTESASLRSEDMNRVVREVEALMGYPRSLSKVGVGGSVRDLT